MNRCLTALMLLVSSSFVVGCGGGGHHSGGGGSPPPVSSALAWTSPATLTRGFLNQQDSRSLLVTGGTQPYTITSIANPIPPGMTLTTFSGGATMNGAPAVNGQYSFTFKVVDAANNSATQTFSWRITSPIVIDTNLPPATHGGSYTTNLAASGGAGAPFTWALQPGSSPPAGLTLSAGGTLSGNVTATVGSYQFTVQATDSGSDTGVAAKTLTLTVQ